MKKGFFVRLLMLAIVIAATVTTTVAGTMAYLQQDTVTQVNKFAVGKLGVVLTEETGVIGSDTKVTQDESGALYNNLIPGDKIIKKVTVSNDGTIDSYVRVIVTLKNDKGNFANLLNKAIDDAYGDDKAQAIYDYMFDGWGLNHSKDLNGDGKSDAGMRLTITGNDMPEHVLHVDSVKTIDQYAQFYSGNMFGEQSDVIPFDGYYTKDMGKYELRYIYYLDLPANEETVLFNGLNIPLDFSSNQLAMFDGLVIDIKADAVQKDGFSGLVSAMLSMDVGDGQTVVEPEDTWDGSVDTSFYNDADTEFVITTAEQLAGFGKLVDDGNTFEGKTVKLGKNIDLKCLDDNDEPIPFNPIGSYRNETVFNGTFDGQGYTIANMSQNTWALNTGYYYGDLGLGLFAAVEDGTVKNLTVDAASISGESALCGIVVAVAENATFENITVKNSNVADYQYYAGGVVGLAYGKTTFTNCNIDASTTVGSQWGDFGNANGGVIGGMDSSAEITIKDSVIACRIDATNDVVSAYQWYNYRNSGMLVGRVPQTTTNGEVQTVATPNVTCENVTVVYGDWANYTYCEFAGTGYPFVRVQAGVSVDGYSNVRYGHPTDADGNTVVDDNHTHNDGEAHHELIEFNQLFGGPADHRYCYYGIAAHPGVTVIYNNK